MIEIVDAYTRSGNEWCTCCQKQTDTKRIKFSYDGRQGNSVVLCDDCRRELARTIQAIPLDRIKQAREEINDLDIHFDNDYFSSNRDAMFKCNEVLEILDKLIESEEY